MALQRGADLLQALPSGAIERILHPVQAPVDPLEGRVLVGRRLVAFEKAIGGGTQHARLLAHEPVHIGGFAQHQLLFHAQLGHHLGPALGDALFDRGSRVDAGLHHLQHILHSQRRIDPLDDDRRLSLGHQLPVQPGQRWPGSTAGGQRHAASGQLLQPLEVPGALAGDEDQRNIADHRPAAGDLSYAIRLEQLSWRNQIALAAPQRPQQLVLGLGDDLQPDGLAGIAIEITLEGTQANVLDANRLTLDLARTVATLVDQHAQHTTAANLGQIAHLGRRLPGLRPCHSGSCRPGQEQHQAEQQ